MRAPSPHYYLHQRNSLTYGSLLTGLLAVFLSTASSWSAVWSLITISIFLDTFDGQFARRFKRNEDEIAFGIQLDSLADAVVFGLVPIVCLYLMLDPGDSRIFTVIWFIGAFAYLVTGLTRLGCYNIHQASGDFFTGMPIPLSALVLGTVATVTRSPVIFILLLAICSWAMVSPLRIPRPTGWKILVFVGWVVAVFILHVAGIGSIQ
jgi:CDP-diacylglycerol--serine O-phosphatidyltransferase